MFGFLLPLPFIGGLGARVAIVVLVAVRAAADHPHDRRRSAVGRSRRWSRPATALGMTPVQLLRQVELPLALPSIVAGIRVAAVIGVGTATIAAAVGAGGLGEYIFRGLSMVDPTVILAGAIPAAVLALTIDGALDAGSSAASSRPERRGVRRGQLARRCACCRARWRGRRRRGTRRAGAIGRRSRRLEEFHRADRPRRAPGAGDRARTGLAVERRLNLGGTFICDRALRIGRHRLSMSSTPARH